MSRDKVYFKNLDSIRFIAAFIVYFGHGFQPCFKYLPIKNTIWETLLNNMAYGGTGVSIFFVLSGFLITYLLISEYELNGKIALKKFYIRRVLRIWPLYYFVVAFSFIFYPFLKSLLGINNPLGSNIIYHLTFLSNFDVINVERFYPGIDALSQNITWSVSIEEQFYLFWPLLFVILPKRFWNLSVILIIAGSLYFRILHYNDKFVLYYHTFSVLLDLGIGGLAACLIKGNRRVRNFFEKTSTLTQLLFFIISFCLILWNTSIFSFKYGNATGRIFISLSFILIIASQAMTKSNSKLNLRNFSFANKWGKYTYGIYLLHPIVLTFLSIIVRVMHLPGSNFFTLFIMGVVGFILTLLLSKISYQYYESKFLLLKDKFETIKTHE